MSIRKKDEALSPRDYLNKRLNERIWYDVEEMWNSNCTANYYDETFPSISNIFYSDHACDDDEIRDMFSKRIEQIAGWNVLRINVDIPRNITDNDKVIVINARPNKNIQDLVDKV